MEKRLLRKHFPYKSSRRDQCVVCSEMVTSQGKKKDTTTVNLCPKCDVQYASVNVSQYFTFVQVQFYALTDIQIMLCSRVGICVNHAVLLNLGLVSHAVICTYGICMNIYHIVVGICMNHAVICHIAEPVGRS